MRTIALILLALPLLAAPPALTGKRRADMAGSKVVEKVERKRTGKKGSTNEWESARSFLLMFSTTEKQKKDRKNVSR
jgi:hypothetical protein